MPALQRILPALLCIAFGTAYAHSQSKPQSPDALRTKVMKDLPQWLKINNVPSASIAYIADGKVAWTLVSGEQSPGVPATSRTLYNIASLTKPIVAETILRMASRNLLQLDEPIYPYWIDPDVKDNPWNQLLTPRLCLSHQTGFANWRRMTNNSLTFQWQPGTRTGYSGEGYMYVARFTQNKVRRPFDELAQQYVLTPIGMTSTSFTTRDWFTGRLAEPFGKDGFFAPQLTSMWSAADLVRTTVSDYASFVVSVMHNEGLTPSIASQRLTMTRNWTTQEELKAVCAFERPNTPCNFAAGMGLGWQVLIHNGLTIVDHSGSDIGAHTLAFFIPSQHIGAVIFTNGENGSKVIAEIVKTLSPDPVYAATIR